MPRRWKQRLVGVLVLQISEIMLSLEGEPGPCPKPTLMFLFFSLIMRIFKTNIYFFDCTRSLMWHVGSLVVCVCVCVRGCTCTHSVVSNCVTPWTVAHQASLSMGFSRQEYWSRMSFPSPEDLPGPGIEPVSLVSPALASGLFTFWTIVVACRLLVEACELLVAACGI